MAEEMDFLDLQIDEMGAIKNRHRRHNFPAVSFYRNRKYYVASFNRSASKKLEGYFFVKIYATAEYVVFAFSNKKDCRSYKIQRNNTGCFFINCSPLQRFKLEGKVFKLYKTEKGLAIKINDPI